MEKTGKFQIVYVGPTNLYPHSTTDIARGIGLMMNRCITNLRCRKYDLSNILNLQAAFYIQFITNEQVKLAYFIWEGSISRILILM